MADENVNEAQVEDNAEAANIEENNKKENESLEASNKENLEKQAATENANSSHLGETTDEAKNPKLDELAKSLSNGNVKLEAVKGLAENAAKEMSGEGKALMELWVAALEIASSIGDYDPLAKALEAIENARAGTQVEVETGIDKVADQAQKSIEKDAEHDLGNENEVDDSVSEEVQADNAQAENAQADMAAEVQMAPAPDGNQAKGVNNVDQVALDQFDNVANAANNQGAPAQEAQVDLDADAQVSPQNANP